jgi:hypothetical protein
MGADRWKRPQSHFQDVMTRPEVVRYLRAGRSAEAAAHHALAVDFSADNVLRGEVDELEALDGSSAPAESR